MQEESKTDDGLQQLLRQLMQLYPERKVYLYAVIVGSVVIVREIGNMPRWYLLKKLASKSVGTPTSP